MKEALGELINKFVFLSFLDEKPGSREPSCNSVLYAIELGKQLEELDITWLEEPLNPDDFDAYEQLAQHISIPIAFGERLPTRRVFAQAIDRGFAAVLQPELFVVGGMTELRKLAVLTAAHSVAMIPHANESCRHVLHMLFTLPTRFSPLGEWGVKINHNTQFFYRDFYQQVNGYFSVPDGPGFGYEIDPVKAVSRKDI